MPGIRLFFAVNIPADVALTESESASAADRVGDLPKTLPQEGQVVRPVPPENLHVTLKFLGDVGDSELPALTGILNSVASRHKSFGFRIRGVGVFPDRRRPVVIWAGLDPPEPWKRVAADLDDELSPIGFLPEQRPFTAHLTLARIRGRCSDAVFRWLDEQTAVTSTTATVAVLHLMRSERLHQGVRYCSVAAASLTGTT